MFDESIGIRTAALVTRMFLAATRTGAAATGCHLLLVRVATHGGF